MYKLKDNFEDIIRDETSHAALTNVNIKDSFCHHVTQIALAVHL